MEPAGEKSATRAAVGWLLACVATGALLLWWHRDSYQQDGGNHYLMARAAWRYPEFFLSVWQRPLFSVVFALPALAGHFAARCWAVLVSTCGAALTWRAALKLGVRDAWRVIPFSLLQLALFEMWADTMTEPLFAAVLAAAILAHVSGRVLLGAVLVSFLPGARPEGPFVIAVWGVMMLRSPAFGATLLKRLPKTLALGTGLGVWVLASQLLAGDPLYILHHWPWSPTGSVYGTGTPWAYFSKLPEICGPVLMVPMLVGLWPLLRSAQTRFIPVIFLLTFGVHTALWTFGLFGSAGYARYFSSFAPCLALAGATGWNALTARWPRAVTRVAWAVVCGWSFIINLRDVDALMWARDAWAVDEMKAWFDANEKSLPVERFAWSQTYAAVAFERDGSEYPVTGKKPEETLRRLRELPPHTLALWDSDTGPALFGLSVDDVKGAGFEELHRQDFVLQGRLPKWASRRWNPDRQISYSLLYKR